MSATAPPDGCVSHVTVCETLWNTHVTDTGAPLRVTVTVDGLNWRLDVALTVPGGGVGDVDELPQATSAAAMTPAAKVRAVARSIASLLTKRGT